MSADEQARLQPGAAVAVQAQPEPAAPRAAPAGAAGLPAREQPAERDSASRQQIAALQAQVRQLERERATLLSRKPADEEGTPREAEGLPPRNKTHDFTAGELQAMVRSCEVRFDLPPLDGDPWKLSPDEGARLRLAEDQQPRVAAAVNKVRGEVVARLRALYLAATGDVGGAQSLAPMTLGQEILHKSRPSEVEAARARIAREHAGLETPPSDPNAGSIPEQYFRYMVTVGDSVQRELESAVGATQAGVIRDRVDGWHTTMNGCKEPADR